MSTIISVFTDDMSEHITIKYYITIPRMIFYLFVMEQYMQRDIYCHKPKSTTTQLNLKLGRLDITSTNLCILVAKSTSTVHILYYQPYCLQGEVDSPLPSPSKNNIDIANNRRSPFQTGYFSIEFCHKR